MPTESTAETGSAGSGQQFQTGSSLPWHLIPSFKPGETDIADYSRRLEFLTGIWPTEALNQLAPRAALLCEGSAFQKILRLPAEKLKVNDNSGVRLLVTTLGGVWGKTPLETRYEKFEKAIYGTNQKNDETNESYVARHEILFEDLVAQGTSFQDLRAYILLRNSGLNQEDKKRVLVDSQGELKYSQVISSIRLLGSKFFGELQGQARTKTKTYDVNYAEEDDQDSGGYNTHSDFAFMAEQVDPVEASFETFLTEGDDDALIIQQFEETLINMLQDDEEMTILMSAYADARRRLSEKSRSRGFWPIRQKSFSQQKGKGKGKRFGRPKTLAERIATSECKICGMRGHWKRECPQRDRDGGKSQAANTLVHTSEEVEESDVLFIEEVTDEDITSVSQDGFCTKSVVDHVLPVVVSDECCFTVEGLNKPMIRGWKPRNHQEFADRVRCSLDRIFKNRSKMNRDIMSEGTPLSTARTDDNLGKPEDTSTMPQVPKNHTSLGPGSLVHDTMFASHGTIGIVDLGASQTVMGEQQVDEFCNQLPAHVRDRIQEKEVSMSFRFGNNCTVQCKRAILIPAGPVWIRVAVVPTVTPFLISNNVFRNLGAIIDTAKQSVFFEKLRCTVPLQLTNRKLFVMDLCDLVLQAEEHYHRSKRNAQVEMSREVLTVTTENVGEHNQGDKQEGLEDTIKTTPNRESTAGTMINPAETQKHVVQQPPSDQTVSHRESPDLRNSCDFQHVTVEPTQCSDQGGSRPGDHGRSQQDQLRRAAEPDNQVREIETRDAVSSGDPRGSGLRHVVRGIVRTFQQEGTCGVPHVCQAICQTHGGKPEGSREDNTNRQEQGHPEDQECTTGSTEHIAGPGRVRGRRSGVGHHHQPPSDEPGGSNDRDGPTHESDGTSTPTSCLHAAATAAEADTPVKELHSLLAGLADTGENHTEVPMDNWVAKEMWSYMRKKGFLSQTSSIIQSCSIDLLEIYCSSDSQLTKQAQEAGLRAQRFGLAQGDLQYADGRRKLYDFLMTYRPRDMWLSPSCKAWCKWAQYNLMQSPETAEKIIQARERDQIHMLLCAAIHEFQCWRGDHTHTHLEQPVGSEMLYQPELHPIYTQLMWSRCDQCVAGNLVHPENKKPIQKGMQILTTSKIMAQYLSKFRCSRNHEHAHVAGSYRDKQGRVSVSSHTELYTAVFAKRVVRAMLASQAASELQADDHLTCHNDIEGEGEQDKKRRRLEEKQPRPPAFEPEPPVPNHQNHKNPEPDTLETILKDSLSLAPRVGKTVVEGGEWFDRVARFYPTKQIRVIELCKGTDRYRREPIALIPGEAPLRKSVGLDRGTLQPHDNLPWERWENMSKRQMVSKSPPSRIMMTVFAKDNQLSSTFSPAENPKFPSQPLRKRMADCSAPSDSVKRPHLEAETKGDVERTDNRENPPQVVTIQHGAKFLALRPEEQNLIRKMHQNLGHPGLQKFKIALSTQGVDKTIIDAVEDYRCSTCHELQKPKAARPSTLSDIREFNDVVGCDGIQWTAKNGKQFFFYHYLDHATNFHLASHTHQTDADGAFTALSKTWIQWAGPCRELVVDGASELCAERFSELAQQQDIHIRVIAAYAHWQLGKTERHGSILQDMLEKYDHEHSITNSQEFDVALMKCCNAKNQLARHKGYTPELLVLGKCRREPGSVTQDVPDAADYLADGMGPEGIAFRTDLARRETARKAFIMADNNDRLRRAILRKGRPYRGSYVNGDIVMFWKPAVGQGHGRWIGPGRVISQENKGVIWLTHSGRIYRTAPEHVRALSGNEAEQYGQSVEAQQSALPVHVGRGVFQYEDLVPPNTGSHEEVVPGDNNDGLGGNIPTPPESIHSQPDNEPSYEPSINPEQETPSPAPSIADPPNPIEVPIPGETDDELFMEDYWIIQKDKLIRKHMKPRKTAFRPTDIEQCPINPLLLADDRITQCNTKGAQQWITEDSWVTGDRSWTETEPWTGHTVFTVTHQDEEIPEDDHSKVEQQENQGWVMEIYLTIEDEQHIRDNPNQVDTFLATVAKRQRSEVKLRDLTSEELREFKAAQNKEIDQWLETETVKKIARCQIPEENIMQCRWIHTWKDLDAVDQIKLGKNRKAKSRLVVLGYQDPNLEDIPRDSPTLQRESRALLCQMAASRKWLIQSFDVKTAFLRGTRRDDRRLGLEPPQELKDRLDIKQHEICELLKSAYGLVNAPYLWFCEIKENLENLGFQASPMDPCLFVLPNPQGKGISGMIGLHVDDGLCAGDSHFEAKLSSLEQKFPFGSKRKGDFIFTGIHIKQETNGSIHLDQQSYVNDITPISIDRDRRKKETLPVTEGERQGLRGLIGSLQYAATNTRPDISARLSFLQSKINHAVIKDLHDGNRLLADAKAHSDTKITISPIPISELQLVSFSDASFASREKQQSQKGCLIVATNQKISKREETVGNPLLWYSKKVNRVVGSTLAAETYALSNAVDLVEWVRIVWAWMCNPKVKWQAPEEALKDITPSIAVVDCKSLYDVINKTTTPQCSEHRTLLEALVIKDRMRQGVTLHWVHSAAQLADSLTKCMDVTPLRLFLKHRKCRLHDIDEVLKDRADRRAQRQWYADEKLIEDVPAPKERACAMVWQDSIIG